MPTVSVRSMQALEDQRAAFNRFSTRCMNALKAAEMDLQRTQAWLVERAHYWERQLRYAEDERARRAIAAEIEKVQIAASKLAEAASTFKDEARRLATLINNDTPRATAFLSTKMAALQAYIATYSTVDFTSASFAGLGLSTVATWHDPGAPPAEPIVVIDEQSLEARVAQMHEREQVEAAATWDRLADAAEARAEQQESPAPSPNEPVSPDDTHMLGGQPETTRSVEQERGPESYEGAFGSPERRG